MKKILFISVLISTLFFSACVNGLYKKGVKSYARTDYAKSIDYFERYLAKKQNNDAVIKLADSYRLTNDYANAERRYSEVVNMPESQSIHMFYYAKALMNQEKYEEAKKWFRNYRAKVPNDIVAQMLLASCNSLNTFMEDTSLYSLKEVEIPELATSFGQTPYKEGIVFTGDKLVMNSARKYGWTGRSYLDLYYSEKDNDGKWLSPSVLKGNINGQYHEGPACFTKGGNVVFFTRSNANGRELKKSATNVNNLKIYKAQLVGDEWSDVSELNFNSDEFSCGHPCLSPDENTLYFISDKPGGQGGTDIYKSVYDGKAWSSPENLGADVNTPGNEMFPYMHSDGSFYFSSDAHNNMGGLDVFVTSYTNNKWLQPENLNYPLNSSKDDFGYRIGEDNKTAYVSSNRTEKDKIYEVTKNDPVFVLSGTVWQKHSIFPVDSAIIEVINTSTKEKDSLYTDKSGRYKVRLKPESKYVVRCHKNMYFTVTAPLEINTVGKKKSEKFTGDFMLEKIVVEQPIVLDNIYYDLDKWQIRPDAVGELNKVVQVMKDNPKISIEMSSHTDSRAGDQYNLILSDKRARAAVSYIVARGVESKRLKWKGYGESRLVNSCTNDVICPEPEHQKNRRTEFKVIKIDNGPVVKGK